MSTPKKQLDQQRLKYARDMLDPIKREAHRKQVREARYKHVYGITYQEKIDMYERQNKLCQICTKELLSISVAFVDHNHTNGAVRGLLCNKCNIGLHYLENKQYLQKAKEYLEKHEINRTSE